MEIPLPVPVFLVSNEKRQCRLQPSRVLRAFAVASLCIWHIIKETHGHPRSCPHESGTASVDFSSRNVFAHQSCHARAARLRLFSDRSIVVVPEQTAKCIVRAKSTASHTVSNAMAAWSTSRSTTSRRSERKRERKATVAALGDSECSSRLPGKPDHYKCVFRREGHADHRHYPCRLRRSCPCQLRRSCGDQGHTRQRPSSKPSIV